MLLVQKIETEETDVKFIVLKSEYKSIKALEAAMKKTPELFNEGCEYSLIDERPFLHIEPQKAVKVVHTDIFWKGDRD